MTALAYTGTALAWPLYEAIAAAINADPACCARLAGDRVFNGSVPTGTDLDYVMLAGTTENDIPLFNRGGGSTATLTMHLFCRSPDNRSTAELYGELHRVLNRSTLVVTGFGAIANTLTLIDIRQDADPDYRHGIARLEVMAIR